MNAILDMKFGLNNIFDISNTNNIVSKFSNYNNSSIGDEFMDILKNGNIRTLFQPIISLNDGSLIGYEALSRGPENSILVNPEKLFDVAKVYGRLWELEFLCRIKAFENISKYKHDFLIFLNVDPNIINDEKFKTGFTKDFLKNFDISPQSVVFEITEKNSVADINSFRNVINNYKNQGYKIAIDDTGSGYSGLKMITDIHPHYIKLDMNLIRDIDKDGLKHALIKTFYDFCRVTDIKLIAEGIETENELNTLIDIGIDYGQGYFIQKPSQQILNIDEGLCTHIKKRNLKNKDFYFNNSSSALIGDICSKNISVQSSFTGANILDIFNNNPNLHGLPVVDNDCIVGLVMKDRFYTKLGTQYGFSLFTNRPISILMDKRPLTVDYKTNIDIVSKLAMTRTNEKLYDYILVTKDSKYYGVVTIKDLLTKITELEINYARHLNPLSCLPGNVIIEEKLCRYINNPKPFTVLYIDIDNFKAYNDVYGFEKGDMILQYLTKILKETCSQYNNFVGHIGGDDFIIIVENYDVSDLCSVIINTFEANINSFYKEEHIQQKYIVACNRKGENDIFGLLTLSIAGISNKDKSFKDIFELSEYSSKQKKKCKEIPGSCYIIDYGV